MEVLLFRESTATFPEAPEPLELPAKDRPMLSAAIQAKEDFLITGDKKHSKRWYGKIIGGVRFEPLTNLLSMFRLRWD